MEIQDHTIVTELKFGVSRRSTRKRVWANALRLHVSAFDVWGEKMSSYRTRRPKPENRPHHCRVKRLVSKTVGKLKILRAQNEREQYASLSRLVFPSKNWRPR